MILRFHWTSKVLRHSSAKSVSHKLCVPVLSLHLGNGRPLRRVIWALRDHREATKCKCLKKSEDDRKKVADINNMLMLTRSRALFSNIFRFGFLKGRQTGGFQTGGFPDLDLPFLFCPFVLFGTFPIFPGFSRFVRDPDLPKIPVRRFFLYYDLLSQGKIRLVVLFLFFIALKSSDRQIQA